MVPGTALLRARLAPEEFRLVWPPLVAYAEEGGVQIAKALPEDVLRRLFAVLMLVVAANIAWRTLRPRA